jgi:hypothetical protein
VQVIRFRRLTSRPDAHTQAEVWEAFNKMDGLSLLTGDAPEPAPRLVTAWEGEGSLEQVRVLVRSGDLQLTDLVDVGDGWQTFEDCILFDAEREWLQRRASLKRWGIAALALLLLGGALLGARLLVA